MAKQCQSCGMPLVTKKAGDCRGTEADGSRSELWCSLCYENGAFIGPECTLDEMRVIVDNALKEKGSSRLFRWLAASQLPKLQRWSGKAK
mgnify:CR=1 FL=1